MVERETLRKAIEADKANDFEAQLLLQKVPLTDFYEYNVFIERLKPNSNYSKSFIWTKDLDEANEVFDDVIKKNTELHEVKL